MRSLSLSWSSFELPLSQINVWKLKVRSDNAFHCSDRHLWALISICHLQWYYTTMRLASSYFYFANSFCHINMYDCFYFTVINRLCIFHELNGFTGEIKDRKKLILMIEKDNRYCFPFSRLVMVSLHNINGRRMSELSLI